VKASVGSAASSAAGQADETVTLGATVDENQPTGTGDPAVDPAADLDAPVESDTRAALRGASPIAFAGLFANLVNIGVTLLVARWLTTRGYGALNQLFAVFFVLSMPGSALLVGIVRRVTLWQRTGHGARVAGWAFRTRRRALVLVAIWAVIAIAIRSPLADQLSLPDPGGLSETLIAGGFWVVLCLERALLQASHAYRALGVNLLVEGLGRCVLTVALVGAGFGVTGAAVALLLSVLLGEAHALLAQGIVDRRALRLAAADHLTPAEQALSEEPGVPATVVVTDAVADTGAFHAGLSTAPDMSAPDPVTFENKRERRSLARDLVSALIALALLAILQNFDVVLLGREEPANSGSYAPISVACKPLVLAAFVLAGFLLPEAASRRHAGQHALRQLGVVLAVIAAPATLLIIISSAVPTQILKVAFGPRLTAAAPAFALLACAMTLLAATVLFTHYLLAAGQYLGLVVLALGAALTVGLLLAAHGGLVATARADLIGQAVVAVASGLLVLHTARPRGRARSVG
jgi:O-antigen/teichoic acid export membrane protein